MGEDERRAYARRVVSNPTWHRIARPHRDVTPEWIENIIANPYHQETDPEDGRELYYGWVDEIQKWMKVVVEDDQLHTAHIDRRLISRFGRLS